MWVRYKKVLDAEIDSKTLLFHANKDILKMSTNDTIANAVYTALSWNI